MTCVCLPPFFGHRLRSVNLFFPRTLLGERKLERGRNGVDGSRSFAFAFGFDFSSNMLLLYTHLGLTCPHLGFSGRCG